jgi:hypothetical protein
LTYDNNGNVTGYGSDSYSWDYRNRLTQSTAGGTDTFYGYDHNNMRVTKGDGTAATTYSLPRNVVSAITTVGRGIISVAGGVAFSS